MRTIRWAGIIFGAIFSAALLGFSTATSALGANVVLMVGGVGASDLRDETMSRILGGAFSDDDRRSVHWPARTRPESIAIGKENLIAALDEALQDLDANEQITIVGLSAGTRVADEVLRELDTNPNAPGKDQLNFTLVADSTRHEANNAGRLDPTPPPETEYDIVVVNGEYDGFVDFPDRWWNLLAVTNALIGTVTVHVPVMFRDLSEVPAENITTTVNAEGGVTTHYFVPAETLPIVQLFRFLEPFEEPLKTIIDRGYSRNDDQESSPVPDDDTVYCAAIGCRPGEPGYPLGGSPTDDDDADANTSLRRGDASGGLAADVATEDDASGAMSNEIAATPAQDATTAAQEDGEPDTAAAAIRSDLIDADLAEKPRALSGDTRPIWRLIGKKRDSIKAEPLRPERSERRLRGGLGRIGRLVQQNPNSVRKANDSSQPSGDTATDATDPAAAPARIG